MVHRKRLGAALSLWIAQLDNQYRAFFVKLVFNYAKSQFSRAATEYDLQMQQFAAE
jgi:hypothetical protein